MDVYGNLYKIVGESDIIWSSHTDTVHKEDGRQKINVVGGYAQLHSQETKSSCLGADCTTGIYIMYEMIKAEVPGLYIFHRDEEIGGLGSRQFAITHKELLEKYKIAIAFDRYGTTSVITHQFERGCSDEFTASLIAQLPGYRPDDGGVFTDTRNYFEIVPECTNLSVGYFNQHTQNEMQDLKHIEELLSLMISLEQDKLVVARDPSVVEYSAWWGGSAYGGRSSDLWDEDDYEFSRTYGSRRGQSLYRSGHNSHFGRAGNTALKEETKLERLQTLVEENPEIIAFLLDQYGFSVSDIEDYIYAS